MLQRLRGGFYFVGGVWIAVSVPSRESLTFEAFQSQF
jgi:hypothetical protein